MSSTPSYEDWVQETLSREEARAREVLAQWEAARARYGGPFVRPANILSVRSGGEYAAEVSYNVPAQGIGVNVTVWGGNSSTVALHGGGGGSGGSYSMAAYYKDESTQVQMVLAAGGRDVAPLSCAHDLVSPVTLLLTDELVASVCELCGEQLAASFEPPVEPSDGRTDLFSECGERIAHWTHQTGEWVIVRDLHGRAAAVTLCLP